MSEAKRRSEPITIDTEGCREAVRVERMLQESTAVRLAGSNGEEIELPVPVVAALAEAVHAFARNEAVSVVPIGRQLTTQQAADMLNVSRPYLVKLLDSGIIQSTKTGSHRRVRLEDILMFRERRDETRRQGLRELVRLSEELGLYDDDDVPGPPRREEAWHESAAEEHDHPVGGTNAESATQA